MDYLKKFKFENLDEVTVKEINDLSVEQLKELKGEKGTLIIRNKKTGQKGQSNYGNLIVLESLGMRKRYDVIGFQTSNVKTELPIGKRVEQLVVNMPYIDEFVAPEVPLFNNLSLSVNQPSEDFKAVEEIQVNAAEEVDGFQFEDFGKGEEKVSEVVVEKPVVKKPAAPRRKMNRK